MIKLDNKNITYVALADSNNSLKAPKEIWYADSNNSVKLVYRRKDALIEGEDYEKYHLLNGYTNDGVPAQGADIGITPISLTNKALTIELGQVSRNVVIYGTSPYLIPMWCMYVNNMYVMQVQERKGNDNTIHNMTYNWTTSNTITLDFINNVATLGNRTFQIEGTGYTFRGFNSAMWQNPRTVGKIKISDELHLVPCKLLKPVPKWLDANGIRRQIGECGMIDLVSGKFYGNVNNVGTFTVENYYERKEWLVGDGSAYIVNKYNLWNNNVETRSAKINLQKTENNDLVYTEANGLNWAIQQNPTLVPQLMVNFREEGVAVHILEVNPTPETFELKFYKKNGYAVCLFDGIEHQGGTMTESKWNKDISPRIYSYKMSYIREVLPNGSYCSNLIPCTLTMDLPASMDANNIARTKGTSGMWDLVSDKFYGNVANSGTFKAVNLAEGVDYEVYDWLHFDSNGSVNAIFMQLPINSSVFNFTRKFSKYDNTAYFWTNNENYSYSCSRNVISIYDRYNRTFVYVSNSLLTDTGGIVVIESSASSLMFNDEQIQQYDFPVGNILWNLSSVSQGTIFDTSSIIVDGIERYIPVKLLKSIPSKYDANGIARQAGECGMYDTVNDVFYGNVASSGSFTVSDDE